jgi:hypothetical protein
VGAVRIDDDFLIAVRARGHDIEFAYLFSDGGLFRRCERWLPTGQRRGPSDQRTVSPYTYFRSGAKGVAESNLFLVSK